MFFTALGIALIAKANPLKFPSTSKSATATTTVSYMTAGVATTTHQYDAYSQPSGFAVDHATLFVSQYASSTASAIDINIEYSQDGIDWYQNGGGFTDAYASTTKVFDIEQTSKMRFGFASSTAGLPSPVAKLATTTRAVSVQTPTRFVRAIFSVPVGSTPTAVWSEWVPIRQVVE